MVAHMKRNSIVSAILLLLVLVCSCGTNSLHRSEDRIRASLLKRTPVGSSRDGVDAYLQKQGWEHQIAPGYTRPILGADDKSRPDVRQSISAKLGDYRQGMLYAPLTDVWATW
jgi:hypothetical protein